MSDAVVLVSVHGAIYSLVESGGTLELVHGREHATHFPEARATDLARAYGGSVFLLDQRRTVSGTLGVGDSGRRT